MLTYIQIYKESLPFSLNMQSLVILILFFFYVWATCLHWVAVGGGSPPIRSSTTKTRLACVLYLAIDLGTTQVLFPLFLSTVMKHSKPSFSVYPPMVLKHSKPSCSLCVCEWKCWSELLHLSLSMVLKRASSVSLLNKSHNSKKRKNIYFIILHLLVLM